MKLFFIFSAICCTFCAANEFVCALDLDLNESKQIKQCKLDIIRHECEKSGTHVSSKTTTENGMVKSDRISTVSRCKDIKINVTDAEYSDDMAYMFVVYDVLTSKNKSIKAEQVDYAEWNNNVHKKMSLEAVERPDSSKVFQISGAIEIDTKEWQEKIQNLKNELAKLKK